MRHKKGGITIREPRIFGYVRRSTPKQCEQRQIRAIKAKYPEAIIIVETYTGTKVEGRKEFERLMRIILPGDTIVYDEVSRMSRDSEEGFEIYQKMFDMGVSLVFLKEPHINTDTYRKTIDIQIQMTGTNADVLLKAVKEYLMLLAKEQIKLAFEQAEKEVVYLRQRTREGIETARINGKQIGQKSGVKLTTKKSVEMKKKILKMAKCFEGNMNDGEVISVLRLSRNTYYKYKKELMWEENL